MYKYIIKFNNIMENLTTQEILECNSLERKLEMQITAAMEANKPNYLNESKLWNDLNEMLKSTYNPMDFTPEELGKVCNKPASEISKLIGTDTGVVVLHFPKKGNRQELYLMCNYRKPARDIVGLLVDPDSFVNYKAYDDSKFGSKYFPDLKIEDADKGGVCTMRSLNTANPGMWEYLTNGFSMNPYFCKTLKV